MISGKRKIQFISPKPIVEKTIKKGYMSKNIKT